VIMEDEIELNKTELNMVRRASGFMLKERKKSTAQDCRKSTGMSRKFKFKERVVLKEYYMCKTQRKSSGMHVNFKLGGRAMGQV